MFDHINKNKDISEIDKDYTMSAGKLLKVKDGHVYYMNTGQHVT